MLTNETIERLELQEPRQVNYIEGDLFAHLKADANIVVAHVCNCYATFGSGFAASVREKYPHTNKEYIRFCGAENLEDNYRPVLHYSIEDFGHFANMICQISFGNQRNATYPDLMKCMRDVAWLCDRVCSKEIYAPKFGAGTCHMNWDFIEELIKDIWLSAGLNVTIFVLPEAK